MRIYIVMEQWPRSEVAEFTTLAEAEAYKTREYQAGRLAMPIIISREK